CDNAREYVGNPAKSHFQELGIQLEPTVPYSPNQNGIAERMNRTIIQKANALRLEADLPETYWLFACQTAAYLRNRSYAKGVPNEVSPEEAWSGKRPSLHHLHIWGCTAYVHKRRTPGDKLQERAWKGVFVGYTK